MTISSKTAAAALLVWANVVSAQTWFVYNPDGEGCLPVSWAFAATQAESAVTTPLSFLESMTANGVRGGTLRRVSSTRTNVIFPDGTVLPFFMSHKECLANRVVDTIPSQAQSSPRYIPRDVVYEGSAPGVFVAIHVTPRITSLVLRNVGQESLKVAPSDLHFAYSSNVSESPCMLHRMTEVDVAPPMLPVVLKPGEQQGYMLGVCSGLKTLPMVLKQPFFRFSLGQRELKLKRVE